MTVITISRQYGSGGDEIARRVAELLGCVYLDERLILRLARETGLCEEEIEDYSEAYYRIRHFLDLLLVGLHASDDPDPPVQDWQTQAGGRPAPDDGQCLALVRGVIEAAYKRGHVIVVGRGGQAILREAPDVLHVRIEAPLTQRVERIQSHLALTPSAAQKLALEQDQAVQRYLKQYHRLDWIDPLLYDLILNTGKLGLEVTARLIVEAVGYLPMAGILEAQAADGP